ncbi:tetratricopeptide repeat protein [Butyrivibrio sp. AE3006]|jgi:tetratricopeptide (TPR) repeat protein|uniref:tetratricopeptide repeat protein n=1 Tax=Butyrivibrio sp. AE3006 TaxID=1280673 RepID=UPI000416678F|nr:tetratricopeptide repeat protein [Butyrivibrio sp. AE3006]
MKCYKCGAELTSREYCPNCGAGVKVYKRIIALSNRYYNEGLERAEVRNMSGAIESLHQSLKLNKSNIQARNLLGLVYYETGEVVAALSEWVISKNLKSEDNSADDYMDMVRNDPSRLEVFNQTIKKYNIALNYCHQDSLDMAVIQLKKVLSMNPGFIRAHLLLALLYLNNGSYAKAKTEAEKSLKLDTGNVMAARYLKEAESMMLPQDLKAQEENKKSGNDIVRYTRDNETIIQPVRQNVFTKSGSIWGIVLGVVLGVAAANFLILPARIQKMNANYKTQISEISEESDSKSAKMGEYEQQIGTLQAQIDELQNEISSYQGADTPASVGNNLMEAASLYLADQTNIEGIEEQLKDVDIDNLGDEASTQFMDLYNGLMTFVGADLSQRSYAVGYDAYRNGDYETAIPALIKAFQYDNTNVDALYNLGNSYYESGDTDNAKVIYDQVINNFEDTRSASSAETKLAEINNATD